MELFGQHEVDDVFDIGDCDRALRDVCRDDDLALSFHLADVPECSVLLVFVERGVQWNEVEVCFQPGGLVELVEIVDELEYLCETWQEDKNTLLLCWVISENVEFLDDVADNE